MEKQKEIKSEKILISMALIMLVAIISYNTFFIPTMPSTVKNTGNIISRNLTPEEKNKSNKTQNLVNINTATEEELIKNLKNVGPAIAKRIIVYRETHDGFSTKEELMNVKGISENVFEKLNNQITIE